MSKRFAAAAVLFVLIASPLHASFADVARAIDSQRGVKRVWIPFLGVARFAVRMVAPEGVHDFQLVTFEGAGKIDARELQKIMRAKIGPGFAPLVQVWSRKSNEWSFIYARPSHDGKRMELVVLAHDKEDTVLVRVEVDAAKIARELGDSPRGVIHVAGR
ncbi:MAG TPA: hypothetical protein VE010_20860 [Thermoanaerobaculia bacterium]|nr:hypothetical protein [Thermoanaerobaculia bacterium]